MNPQRLLALAPPPPAVERLVLQTSGGPALFQELQLVAESQERQHRAMGKRVCGATYRGSVRDAVHYFTCKAVLEPIEPPKGWAEFAKWRRDSALGQACRELVREKHRSELFKLETEWHVLAIDYVSDIAGDR